MVQIFFQPSYFYGFCPRQTAPWPLPGCRALLPAARLVPVPALWFPGQCRKVGGSQERQLLRFL